jgi:hypothetical protein
MVFLLYLTIDNYLNCINDPLLNISLHVVANSDNMQRKLSDTRKPREVEGRVRSGYTFLFNLALVSRKKVCAFP